MVMGKFVDQHGHTHSQITEIACLTAAKWPIPHDIYNQLNTARALDITSRDNNHLHVRWKPEARGQVVGTWLVSWSKGSWRLFHRHKANDLTIMRPEQEPIRLTSARHMRWESRWKWVERANRIAEVPEKNHRTKRQHQVVRRGRPD